MLGRLLWNDMKNDKNDRMTTESQSGQKILTPYKIGCNIIITNGKGK